MLLRGPSPAQAPAGRPQWQLGAVTHQTAPPEVPRRDAIFRAAGSGVPDWQELLPDKSVAQRLPGYALRPGQKPSTVNGSVLPTAEGTSTKKDVLLYRGAHAACVAPPLQPAWLTLLGARRHGRVVPVLPKGHTGPRGEGDPLRQRSYRPTKQASMVQAQGVQHAGARCDGSAAGCRLAGPAAAGRH